MRLCSHRCRRLPLGSETGPIAGRHPAGSDAPIGRPCLAPFRSARPKGRRTRRPQATGRNPTVPLMGTHRPGRVPERATAPSGAPAAAPKPNSRLGPLRRRAGTGDVCPRHRDAFRKIDSNRVRLPRPDVADQFLCPQLEPGSKPTIGIRRRRSGPINLPGLALAQTSYALASSYGIGRGGVEQSASLLRRGPRTHRSRNGGNRGRGASALGRGPTRTAPRSRRVGGTDGG